MSPFSGRHYVISSNDIAVVLNAGFGKAPQGVQLSLVEQSPNYRDGQFHNQLPTLDSPPENMLAAVGFSGSRNEENARPQQPLPLVNTDLAGLPSGEDVMVWLGHPSWYLCSWRETYPDRPGI